MAEDAVAPTTAARPHRRVSAFRRWRSARPFWGGLFMMLCGGELFLSSNEDLGSLHVQIGVTGFLSYIVPLFVILCGALAWATPSQRVLYGILANAAAIYSIVSVNLGGFVLGMLFGIVGGSLAVAWVPDKFSSADIPEQRVDAPDDAGESFFEPETDTEDFLDGAYGEDDPTTGDLEGKQGARFPGPRQPVEQPDPEVNRSLMRPSLPRRSPRTVAIALVVTLIGVVGFVAVRTAEPAAAADCVPPTLTQIVQSAKAKAKHPATSKGKSSTGKKSSVTGQSQGEAPVMPHPQATGPVSTILGGLGSLLGLTPSPSDSPSEAPTPSETPSDSPAPAPARAPRRRLRDLLPRRNRRRAARRNRPRPGRRRAT